MTIHSKSVDPIGEIRSRFSAFDELAFVNWLDNGLQTYYSPVKRDPPFSFASFFIGRLDSILDDLGYIYRQLIPIEQQPLFRSSIGRLLRRDVSSERLPEDAISDLIYLIAEIHAYESLDSLSVVVGENRYAEKLPWLQYEAISILKQLLPSREAIDGLRHFVTSSHFNYRFAFDILTALCESDPLNWPEHIALLSSSIDALYEEAEKKQGDAPREVFEEEMTFQNTFARSVPTSLICDGITGREYEFTHIKSYERCIQLIRQLQTRRDSPAHIAPDPSSTTDKDVYTVTIVIGEDRSREVRFNVSCKFYFILFKKATDRNNYLTLLNPSQKQRFKGLDSSLRIVPRSSAYQPFSVVGTT